MPSFACTINGCDVLLLLLFRADLICSSCHLAAHGSGLVLVGTLQALGGLRVPRSCMRLPCSLLACQRSLHAAAVDVTQQGQLLGDCCSQLLVELTGTKAASSCWSPCCKSCGVCRVAMTGISPDDSISLAAIDPSPSAKS